MFRFRKNFLITGASLGTTFPLGAAIENKESSRFERYGAARDCLKMKKFVLLEAKQNKRTWNKGQRTKAVFSLSLLLATNDDGFFVSAITGWMIERSVVCHGGDNLAGCCRREQLDDPGEWFYRHPSSGNRLPQTEAKRENQMARTFRRAETLFQKLIGESTIFLPFQTIPSRSESRPLYPRLSPPGRDFPRSILICSSTKRNDEILRYLSNVPKSS